MWVSSCRNNSSISLITNRLHNQTAIANLHACGISQAITLKLLTSWGYDGFLQHTRTVSEFYRQKRDVFEKVLHKHLEGLAEWSSPEAGMFVWYVNIDSLAVPLTYRLTQVQTPPKTIKQ